MSQNRGRIFCAGCGRLLTCERNGIVFVTANGSTANADLWRCDNCDFKVITGLGNWLLPDCAARSIETMETAYPEELFDFREIEA